MKHPKRYNLYYVPFLALLVMSQSSFEKKLNYRQIASSQELLRSHPKYDLVVGGIDQKALLKDNDPSVVKTVSKLEKFAIRLEKETSNIKKSTDNSLLTEQKSLAESLAVDLALIEIEFKNLGDTIGVFKSDEDKVLEMLTKSKDGVERVLEVIGAKELDIEFGFVTKKEVVPSEEPKEGSKEATKDVLSEQKIKTSKEEVKVEPKEEDKPKEEVVAKVKEIAPKLEDKTTQDELVCELQDKNQSLQKQLEDVISEQKQIMQAILGMAQMMVSMFQNQSLRTPQPQSYPFNNQLQASAYQYHQPQVNGNWVYYPQGFQPTQSNIFAPPTQGQEAYSGMPSNSYGGQSNWALRPDNYFDDPRYSPQPMKIGSFGIDPFSYNLNSPQLSMI